MLTIKYFASLRDTLGRDSDVLAYDKHLTVKDVWGAVTGDLAFPANLMVAVNQQYASLTSSVKDGDEIAFFPPVTGG